MKEGFRQSMAWLHTWVGLVVGWVLFFVFVTGTAGYFQFEITRWMEPERPLRQAVAPVAVEAGVATAQAVLTREAGDAPRWIIHVNGGREGMDWRLHWPGLRENLDHGYGSIFIDPASGARLQTEAPQPPRATGGGNALYHMHYQLYGMAADTGVLIVGACTMLMLLAIVSGVITHKKFFADFFTFRPGKGQRSWLDAHNVISVTALPFFLMITYSGLVFFMDRYLPAAMHAEYGWDQQWPSKGYSTPLNPRANARFDPLYQPNPEWEDAPPGSGQPAPLADLRAPVRQAVAAWGAGKINRIWIEHPGQAGARITLFHDQPSLLRVERTMVFDGVSGKLIGATPPARRGVEWNAQNLLTNLHEGVYAGWLLRWLYFLSGLLGCAMIATGLVLWTVKRRRKQEAEFGFRLVESLNIATVAGLCTAVAVYFWANRLLPVELAARAKWEQNLMFLAWGLLLLHASLRLRFTIALRVWHEQLWLAALAFAALPLLNALTTSRHLGVTLPAGDWMLASVDLTLLALGLCMAAAAHKVGRKLQAMSA